MKQIKEAQEILRATRKVYAPGAKRVAKLFFLMSDMSKINSLYQFSYNWFIELFKTQMEDTRIEIDIRDSSSDPVSILESTEAAINAL